MMTMTRIKQLSMLGMMGAAVTAGSTQVAAFDCPNQGCGYCPATWAGDCYIPGSTSCEEFECINIGTCGGGYTLCYCPPCC
jgi:hypothetical protein